MDTNKIINTVFTQMGEIKSNTILITTPSKKGTATSKAQIMRSLGSNFLLNGESLGITIEKPFEILIKNKDLIRDESNGVKPCETTDKSSKKW